jgi:hypothetical protein
VWAFSPTYKPPLGAFRCQWSGELRRWVVIRVAVTGLEPGMSDEFKRELREIGSRLKVRREATLSAQQDQLSRVEAAIQWWEKGIASNIRQAVQEANTALAGSNWRSA